ncbi:hypothetical protein BKN14_01320 [Candidatus Gracilibacteria bacterium HOT-871]|nr:hypothetical protein BKN14_01320 [Candidatus Gracilibacteria bacterium HOT-871]
MIEKILLVVLVLTTLIYYIVLIDIILSWLSLFGLNLRINFFKSILDPIYDRIKNIIPTTIGPFELAPIILIFALFLVQGLINAYDSSIYSNYRQLIPF